MIVLSHVALPDVENPARHSGASPSVIHHGLPLGWSEFTPAVRALRADIILARRKWNAFQGTDLDSQLRHRGITTLVLAGATTHVAVEFTARDAHHRNYSVIIAEDAVTSIDPEFHRFSLKKVLPRFGTVCPTTEILAAYSQKSWCRPPNRVHPVVDVGMPHATGHQRHRDTSPFHSTVFARQRPHDYEEPSLPRDLDRCRTDCLTKLERPIGDRLCGRLHSRRRTHVRSTRA
jgi:hypothetical protein